MTATSSVASVPSTVAVYFVPVPPTWTEIPDDPAMTWLLVSTTPDGVRSMPVPAALAPSPARVVVISTSPRVASGAAVPGVAGVAGAGVAGGGVAGAGVVGSGVAGVGVVGAGAVEGGVVGIGGGTVGRAVRLSTSADDPGPRASLAVTAPARTA